MCIGPICGYSGGESGVVYESTRWQEKDVHAIHWWLEVVAPGSTRPLKNQIIGFPRILTSSLIPNLATN